MVNLTCKCCDGLVEYYREMGYWNHDCPHEDCGCDKKKEEK